MGHETSEVQKLRTEFRQMVQLRQASRLDATRNTLAEIMRNNGQSESGGVVGSAAVGESPARAGPIAVGDSPGGAVPTAVRDYC